MCFVMRLSRCIYRWFCSHWMISIEILWICFDFISLIDHIGTKGITDYIGFDLVKLLVIVIEDCVFEHNWICLNRSLHSLFRFLWSVILRNKNFTIKTVAKFYRVYWRKIRERVILVSPVHQWVVCSSGCFVLSRIELHGRRITSCVDFLWRIPSDAILKKCLELRFPFLVSFFAAFWCGFFVQTGTLETCFNIAE